MGCNNLQLKISYFSYENIFFRILQTNMTVQSTRYHDLVLVFVSVIYEGCNKSKHHFGLKAILEETKTTHHIDFLFVVISKFSLASYITFWQFFCFSFRKKIIRNPLMASLMIHTQPRVLRSKKRGKTV